MLTFLAGWYDTVRALRTVLKAKESSI